MSRPKSIEYYLNIFFILYLESPEAPRNLTVQSIASREVKVEWKKPYDGNSDILFYIVEYIKQSGKHENIKKTLKNNYANFMNVYFFLKQSLNFILLLN